MQVVNILGDYGVEQSHLLESAERLVGRIGTGLAEQDSHLLEHAPDLFWVRPERMNTCVFYRVKAFPQTTRAAKIRNPRLD